MMPADRACFLFGPIGSARCQIHPKASRSAEWFGNYEPARCAGPARALRPPSRPARSPGPPLDPPTPAPGGIDQPESGGVRAYAVCDWNRAGSCAAVVLVFYEFKLGVNPPFGPEHTAHGAGMAHKTSEPIEPMQKHNTRKSFHPGMNKIQDSARQPHPITIAHGCLRTRKTMPTVTCKHSGQHVGHGIYSD